MKLFIEYDEHDDLSNIGDKVIMDLDPDNKIVVLGFEYYLSEDRFNALKSDYKASTKEGEGNPKGNKDVSSFIKNNIAHYFQIAKKSILFDTTLQKEDDSIFTDLLKEKIQIDKIINFKWISAKRNVSNKDTENTLSSQSARIYNKMEAKNSNPVVIAKFKEALYDTDENLNNIYREIFQEVIDDVKTFGGIKQEESVINCTRAKQNLVVYYCDPSQAVIERAIDWFGDENVHEI